MKDIPEHLLLLSIPESPKYPVSFLEEYIDLPVEKEKKKNSKKVVSYYLN